MLIKTNSKTELHTQSWNDNTRLEYSLYVRAELFAEIDYLRVFGFKTNPDQNVCEKSIKCMTELTSMASVTFTFKDLLDLLDIVTVHFISVLVWSADRVVDSWICLHT